jgi:hypothetical protein
MMHNDEINHEIDCRALESIDQAGEEFLDEIVNVAMEYENEYKEPETNAMLPQGCLDCFGTTRNPRRAVHEISPLHWRNGDSRS